MEANLLAAARSIKVPAALSRDAGRYLCNYLCWRASEAATENGLRLAAFVHVPPVTRKVLRPSKRHRASLDDLSRAADCFLTGHYDNRSAYETPLLGPKLDIVASP